jgi:hypothetical protein
MASDEDFVAQKRAKWGSSKAKTRGRWGRGSMAKLAIGIFKDGVFSIYSDGGGMTV